MAAAIGKTLSLAARLYRCRWSAVRLVLALAILWLMVVDNPARLTRLQLAALPDYDYAAEAQRLQQEARYSEALMVIRAGLDETTGDARERLTFLQQEIQGEKDSWMRRVKAAGGGAISGHGDSIEALAGAIAADMFVVGDVRDLTLEGGRLLVDGEADPVIAGLSAVGLLLTVAPEFDMAAAVLKAARRAGAMSRAFVDRLTEMIRLAVQRRQVEPISRLAVDVQTVADLSTTAGAIRVMRHLDDPADLSRVAEFLKRNPDGALALHVGGKPAVDFLTDAGRGSDALLVAAAKKGPRGIEWLRSINPRLLRPHPLIGATKAFWKGNAPQFLQRFTADILDPSAWLIIPAVAVWALLEIVIITGRLAPRRATA